MGHFDVPSLVGSSGMTKIIIVVNEPGFFVSHRLPIAIAARDRGYEVHVATGPGKAIDNIKKMGFQHHLLPLSRSGRNPIGELILIWNLILLFRRVRPALIHLVTIKPVLYGGIAARICKVPAVVAAISGLGYSFTNVSLKSQVTKWIVTALFRLSFKNLHLKVIFQNSEDLKKVTTLGNLKPLQTEIIRGSGIDLKEYSYLPEPMEPLVVAFAGRLLKDKGISEFIHAASLLKRKYPTVQFWVVGDADPGNPASVSSQELARWKQDGVAEFLGYRTDIGALFSKSNIVVLPSYREGLPKVLAEAAACGRAVVTTDVPGCRDAIEPGLTGALVPPRTVEPLVTAIERFILNPEERRKMGVAGRKLAETHFDIQKIVEEHLKIYEDLLSTK